MLQKVRPHLILALVFLALTLSQQYGFYFLKGFPITYLPAGKYIMIWLFYFFLTFTKGSELRFSLLSFILILNFFQMTHLSYFGTQILPSEISLLFTQAGEWGGTLKEEFEHVLLPFAFTLIPLALGWLSIKKIPSHFQWKIVPILFCAYFIYNPVRTFITGNTWGRQPSTRELTGMNVYLSLSYFLGRILPAKFSGTHQNSALTSPQLNLLYSQPSAWDNIIVVLGESLTPHHMSLFGYERTTTPYLNSLKTTPSFFSTVGLSGGVSTDISVALFFNFGFGTSGGLKAAKGEHCLLKLAKKQNFSTHYLSTQSDQQLRYIAPYICPSFLDNYQSLEKVSPKTSNPNAANDRDLLPSLSNILKDKSGHFIILHQRGSHAPWNLRSTKESRIFQDGSNQDQRIIDYDHSVVEFDLFWKELAAILEIIPQKTLVIYISDHGEALGKKGKWGHGFLNRSSFEVPVLIQSFHQNLPSSIKKLPANLPHYNVALFLAEEMGLRFNQSSTTQLKEYIILGNDIDGFAGHARIEFHPNDYQFKVFP